MTRTARRWWLRCDMCVFCRSSSLFFSRSSVSDLRSFKLSTTTLRVLRLRERLPISPRKSRPSPRRYLMMQLHYIATTLYDCSNPISLIFFIPTGAHDVRSKMREEWWNLEFRGLIYFCHSIINNIVSEFQSIFNYNHFPTVSSR